MGAGRALRTSGGSTAQTGGGKYDSTIATVASAEPQMQVSAVRLAVLWEQINFATCEVEIVR